jgi:hypothetical protein
MLARIRTIRPVGFIAGFVAAIVLTGGGAAAYAANGGSLLIGRSNTGSATTTLTNTGGTPLKLNAKSQSYAPLAVNSSKVVTNLNADKLDGITEAQLARAAGKTGNITGTSDWAPADPNDPASLPDPSTGLIIGVATCPSGTKLTGGGSDNFTTGFTFVDAPDTNSWIVMTDADSAQGDTPADVDSYAVCFNPRGSVVGAQANARTARPALSAATRAKLAKAIARAAR